jgi:hypothetical protein
LHQPKAIHYSVTVQNCTLLNNQTNIQVRPVEVQVELASSFAAGHLLSLSGLSSANASN